MRCPPPRDFISMIFLFPHLFRALNSGDLGNLEIESLSFLPSVDEIRGFSSRGWTGIVSVDNEERVGDEFTGDTRNTTSSSSPSFPSKPCVQRKRRTCGRVDWARGECPSQVSKSTWRRQILDLDHVRGKFGHNGTQRCGKSFRINFPSRRSGFFSSFLDKQTLGENLDCVKKKRYVFGALDPSPRWKKFAGILASVQPTCF